MARRGTAAPTPSPGAFAAAALVAAALSAGTFTASCTVERERAAVPPTWAEVGPLLATRCGECHADAGDGRWHPGSYVGTLGCVDPLPTPATLPADARAPLLAALDTPTHAALLSAAERGLLRRWVAAGAPASLPRVHEPGVADPRSPAFHGAALRARRWRPMLDASDEQACGRCHRGTPVHPLEVTRPAPGATDCTACHTDPAGALGCGTCHGQGERAAPPRDACLFPADAAAAGAHAAHLAPRPGLGAPGSPPVGYPCGTCHPTPGFEVVSGRHANGAVEVTFSAALAGPGASYDPSTGACALACHDRGGARARPRWRDATPLGCGDCHGAPPADHAPGPCDRCHAEANADGSALSGGPLHGNGRVDVGDGSGGCGACHGEGASAWPTSAAHASHAAPRQAVPVACADCHPVPEALHAAGHLDGVVQVALGGAAAARGAAPTWDGVSCAEVACHGAALARSAPTVVPRWDDTSGAALACDACHGAPPPRQHTTALTCGRADCHTDAVARSFDGVLSLTPAGRARHVDGVVDVAR